MTTAKSNSSHRARKKQILRGISWNAANVVVTKGLSIFVRLLLARLLAPEHFGLLAMVVVALGLAKIFVDFGMKNALIQRARDAQSTIRYDSSFWFLSGSGAGVTLLFATFGAVFLAWFYEEPDVREIASVMSLSIFLHSLSIVPEVRLIRRLRFRSIVISEVISTITAALLAVGLAYFFAAGVWALVAQQLTSIGMRTAMIWRFSKWRPRLRYSWASLSHIVKFSGYMLGAQIIHFARTNMDSIAIGAMLGATPLGIYSIAYLITENVRMQIAGIISKVMLPVYSQMQERPTEIKPHYLSVTRAMATILFPFLLTIALYADPIISFLFTSTWSDAIVPARILAIAGMVYAISGPAPEVLQGIGKARTVFLISLANVIIVGLPAIWFLTSWYGLAGAAWAMVATFTGMRLFSYFALNNLLEVDLLSTLRASGPAVVLALILAVLDETWFNGNITLGLPLILFSYGLLAGLTIMKHRKSG